MKRRIYLALFIASAFPLVFGFGPLHSSALKISSASTGGQLYVNTAYGKLPLAFEPNQGQTDSQVSFLCRGRGYDLFITQGEAALTLKYLEKKSKLDLRKPLKDPKNHPRFQQEAVRLQFKGSNVASESEGLEKLLGISNYFIGNDKTKWRTNIPQFAKVRMKSVYPGIDVVYYGNQGNLEYDFEISPGADPNQIQLDLKGATAEVNASGDLVLTTPEGGLTFKAPQIYQEQDGEKQLVEGRYKLTGTTLGFEVKEYDQTRKLVIDPQLDYSTYLGGSGSDYGNAIAVDSNGNAYITGEAGSTNFPTTAGAYQTTLNGSQNAFVTKLNPAGTGLVYSTYLGGSSYGDDGFAIAVDSNGNAYVTGQTISTDFPTTSGAFQTTMTGTANAFVTKLNAAGNGLAYSTYLGGTGDDTGVGVAIDSSGNAYVAGNATSNNFPTTSGSYQTVYGGSQNAFITKVNAVGTALVYSTYLGISAVYCTGIAIDSSGNAYVTGYTNYGNYPTTAGAYQTVWGGGYDYDAIVTKMNATGTGLIYSTYLGGSLNDAGSAIAVDSSGNAYVAGTTSSTNFPTTAGAYQTSLPDSHSAFVTKLNPAGSNLIYSTYLGGNDYETASGITFDSGGNAYVAGETLSSAFPTTAGAYQTTLNGTFNAYVTKLNAVGTGLEYSSYLGGSSSDGISGMALDSGGNLYVTGYADSSNFPTTSGAYQTSLNGTENGFVTKFGVNDFGPTATITNTPIFTASNTATATTTKTPSSTSTITPSFTPTGTPTITSTATPTSTPTTTTNITDTPTITNTPTVTPTFTPSGTPTSTLTNSPTSTVTNTPTITNTGTTTKTTTITLTPTDTPTPAATGVVIGPPYPNPVMGSGPVSIQVQLPTGSTVEWSVFTTAFRKVLDVPNPVSGNSAVLVWNLEDNWQKQVANGLYYLRVHVTGPVKAAKILKILVIR